jgi:hypothetical protein
MAYQEKSLIPLKTSNISLKSAKNRIRAGIFLWNKDMEKGSVCCFSFYRNLIPSGSKRGEGKRLKKEGRKADKGRGEAESEGEFGVILVVSSTRRTNTLQSLTQLFFFF